MNKKTYIDLFCGAGGLSLGLAKADFELSFASDIEVNSILTFKKILKLHTLKSMKI